MGITIDAVIHAGDNLADWINHQLDMRLSWLMRTTESTMNPGSTAPPTRQALT